MKLFIKSEVDLKRKRKATINHLPIINDPLHSNFDQKMTMINWKIGEKIGLKLI